MSVAFPPCPECEGSGHDPSAESDFQSTVQCAEVGAPECHRCPSCGGCGVLITDELVEVGAHVFYAEKWGDHHPRDNAKVWSQCLKRSREVLVAVVEKLKENQQ